MRIRDRLGVGKVRHIEVNQLSLQAKVANGEIRVDKVAGDKNLAGALTKPVERNKLDDYMRKTCGRFEVGRRSLAPSIEEGNEAITRRGGGGEK